MMGYTRKAGSIPRMANMSGPNKLRPRRPRRTARKSVHMLDKHMSLEQGQTPHLEGSSRAVLGILGRLHQPRAGTTRSPAHNHNRPMACRNNPNMVTQIQPGYEPPQQGYQAPGVQGVSQQFSQMNIGAGPQSQQPQQPAMQMRLNPLQPVDISPQGQPFHVTDLDQPPPPIILPPNVRNSNLIALGIY